MCSPFGGSKGKVMGTPSIGGNLENLSVTAQEMGCVVQIFKTVKETLPHLGVLKKGCALQNRTKGNKRKRSTKAQGNSKDW